MNNKFVDFLCARKKEISQELLHFFSLYFVEMEICSLVVFLACFNLTQLILYSTRLYWLTVMSQNKIHNKRIEYRFNDFFLHSSVYCCYAIHTRSIRYLMSIICVSQSTDLYYFSGHWHVVIVLLGAIITHHEENAAPDLRAFSVFSFLHDAYSRKYLLKTTKNCCDLDHWPVPFLRQLLAFRWITIEQNQRFTPEIKRRGNLLNGIGCHPDDSN